MQHMYRKIKGKLHYHDGDRACTRFRFRADFVRDHPEIKNKDDEPFYEIIYLYGKEQLKAFLEEYEKPVIKILEIGTKKTEPKNI
jgi:hypothetical protein